MRQSRNACTCARGERERREEREERETRTMERREWDYRLRIGWRKEVEKVAERGTPERTVGVGGWYGGERWIEPSCRACDGRAVCNSNTGRAGPSPILLLPPFLSGVARR